MDEQAFLQDYLHPSTDGLDRRFTLPLPDSAGFVKTADFILQSSCPPTCSINVISRHENRAAETRVVEVYKNSRNAESGKFVRLAGTMAVVKKGYPLLILDAAVTNIDLQTRGGADTSTKIAVHMPQADEAGRRALLAEIAAEAERKGIASRVLAVASLPPFWGQLLSISRRGVDFDAIAALRGAAWRAYLGYCSRMPAAGDFDYRPVQLQMILKNAQAEHDQFLRMGLDVPAEAQAAFFSILCTGL